jgi:hypothetical protein
MPKGEIDFVQDDGNFAGVALLGRPRLASTPDNVGLPARWHFGAFNCLSRNSTSKVAPVRNNVRCLGYPL